MIYVKHSDTPSLVRRTVELCLSKDNICDNFLIVRVESRRVSPSTVQIEDLHFDPYRPFDPSSGVSAKNIRSSDLPQMK